MPNDNPVKLLLQLCPGDGVDYVQTDRATRRLVRELRDLDVESVSLASAEGTAPAGSKGGLAVEFAVGLAIQLAADTITKLLDYIASRNSRDPHHTVCIKLPGDGSFEIVCDSDKATEEDVQRLIATLQSSLQAS